jgi:hypothetical protein
VTRVPTEYETEVVDYVRRVPAPPLDRFIDDIYCLTGFRITGAWWFMGMWRSVPADAVWGRSADRAR